MDILTSGNAETGKYPSGLGQKSVTSLPSSALRASEGETGDWFSTSAFGRFCCLRFPRGEDLYSFTELIKPEESSFLHFSKWREVLLEDLSPGSLFFTVICSKITLDRLPQGPCVLPEVSFSLRTDSVPLWFFELVSNFFFPKGQLYLQFLVLLDMI